MGEKKLLSSLLVEVEAFEASQRKFFDIYNAALLRSASDLLEISLEHRAVASLETVDNLLADLTWYMNPAVVRTPELDSLVTGGDLSQISNVELRQNLIVLQHDIDLYRSLMQTDVDFYSNRLLIYLEENTNLIQIGSAEDGIPGGVSPIQNPFRKFLPKSSVDHREILSDPVFRNLLVQRVWGLTEISNWRPPGLEDRIDNIATLIEQQLD